MIKMAAFSAQFIVTNEEYNETNNSLLMYIATLFTGMISSLMHKGNNL